jgi:hypothetical protein
MGVPLTTISVNFVVELPEAHGYDVIMVTVDSVGTRAHFIQTHTTITAREQQNSSSVKSGSYTVCLVTSSPTEDHSSSWSSPRNYTNL